MSTFGKELLRLRTKQGWTLREAEKRSGVSRQTVLRAEEGAYITLDTVIKLLSIYDVVGKAKDKMMTQWTSESVKHARARRATKKLAASRRAAA